MGTLGSGLAHFPIAGATGYSSPMAMVLVNLGALLMWLGISLGFYGWFWWEAETHGQSPDLLFGQI